MNVFQQIRNSISVVDYLRGKGLSVKQIGSGYELEECPFCHGHNCFRVFDNGKRWSCFQCPDRRMGKDVIDLEYYFGDQVSYNIAIKALASEQGIDYSQEELSITALTIKAEALQYFQSILGNIGKIKEYEFDFKGQKYKGTVWDYLTKLRKHSERCISEARLGMSDGMLLEHLLSKGFKLKEIRASGLLKEDRDLFSKEGLIIYPHFVEGKLSHFTCKDPTGKMTPFQTETRFRNEAWRFYNQEILLDDTLEDKALMLVEGENDLLSVIYKGEIPNCIAMIGTISDSQIKSLQNLSQSGWAFIMAFDGDEQGKKYRNLVIERVGGNLYDVPISEIGIPNGKDIDDILCASDNPKDLINKILSNLNSDPKLYKLTGVAAKTIEAQKDKTPYSLEHERFILRNLIRGDNLIEIFNYIKDENFFYKTTHKAIFKALKDLYDINKTINELISYTLLWETKVLKNDSDYEEIMQDTFASDIESALDILEKKYRRRAFLDFSNEVQKKIVDESIPVEKIEEEVSDKFFTLYKTRDSKSVEMNVTNLSELELANKKAFKLVGTPFEDWNETLVIGFDHGNIVTLAGRTGMGKSLLKNTLKKYWCEKGFGVLDFTPENRVKLEQARLDSLLTGVPFKQVWTRVENDLIDIKCQEAHKKIISENWALWQIEELEHLDLSFVARKIRQAKKERQDIESWIICVDLADKIKEFKAGRDIWRTIEVSLSKMKILSSNIGFCFMPVVQIGRGSEQEKKISKRRPELHDLRGSGAWEQDSDMVLLLFREKYYDKSINTDILEINLAKQRGGHPAVFKKLFEPEICKISDYNEGSYEELPPAE